MSLFELNWQSPTQTIAALKKENGDLRLLIAVLFQTISERDKVIRHAARKLGEVKRDHESTGRSRLQGG